MYKYTAFMKWEAIPLTFADFGQELHQVQGGGCEI